MKTITTLITGILAVGFTAAGAQVKVMKPWEATLGAIFWQGDHDDVGFDTGFMLGLDYHLSKTENMMTFVGGRWMSGSGGGLDDRTFGFHYGIKSSFGDARTANPLYWKAAGGLYNTELSNGGSEDKWSFGGFLALGYEFNAGPGPTNMPLSAEIGYFFMPKVIGVDNTGFYAALGLRF